MTAITAVGVTREDFMQALQDYPDWGNCLKNAERVAEIWMVSALDWPEDLDRG